MRDKKVSISNVAIVAKALSELKDKMVFVGGAIVSLYADIESDEELRETYDIDITSIEVLTYGKYNLLLERLSQLGFHPDPEGHAICSLKYKELAVDIMPSEDGPIGPANKWYKLGFNDLLTIRVDDEEIKVFSAPCYLATKFEAFNNRGGDHRTSHDFEDIIYVMDNRTSIVHEIQVAQTEIMNFLIHEFKKIHENKYMEELLSAHLSPNTVEERYPIILDKVNQIIKL